VRRLFQRSAAKSFVTVVPDSGTGQLAGLTGNFSVKSDTDKHSYGLEYPLPAS